MTSTHHHGSAAVIFAAKRPLSGASAASFGRSRLLLETAANAATSLAAGPLLGCSFLLLLVAGVDAAAGTGATADAAAAAGAAAAAAAAGAAAGAAAAGTAAGAAAIIVDLDRNGVHLRADLRDVETETDKHTTKNKMLKTTDSDGIEWLHQEKFAKKHFWHYTQYFCRLPFATRILCIYQSVMM